MANFMSFEERNIANSLMSGLAIIANDLTREQVEDKANQVAKLFDYKGNIGNIIETAMMSINARKSIEKSDMYT